VELVDESGLDRLGGEIGTADGDVVFRRCFQRADRFGVELGLDRVLVLATAFSVLE
jgi:hypothetical protein